MLLPFLFALAITEPTPEVTTFVIEPLSSEDEDTTVDETLAQRMRELKPYHWLTRDDAAGDRTFLAPTADTLAEGRYTLAWYPPFFMGASYGISDAIEVTYRGTPPNFVADLSVIDAKFRVRKGETLLIAVNPYFGFFLCPCTDGAGIATAFGSSLEATALVTDRTSISGVIGGGAYLAEHGTQPHGFGSLAVWHRLFSFLAFGVETAPAFIGFPANILTGGMRVYSPSISLDVFGGKDVLSEGGYGYFTVTLDPSLLASDVSGWFSGSESQLLP